MFEYIFKTLEDVYSLSYIYLMTIDGLFRFASSRMDDLTKDYQRSSLILITILCCYLLNWFINNVKLLSKRNILIYIRSLPVLRDYVQRKLDKVGRDIKKELTEIYQNESYISGLPIKSTGSEILLKKLKHYQMFDTSNWQAGRISGAIYTNNSSRYNEFLLSVYGSYMWSNPLHSDVFASVRKMESEVVRMVADMYEGNPKTVMGTVTSGGTESIIMACKAYRDYALKFKGIKGQPEIVAPVTAHAAFEKAANILGCKIIHIPIDKKSLKVDIGKMRRAINGNTCMLVGSAPNFPHGIIDPIVQISKLGLAHDIPVHVDACLGGFLIPFMKFCNHKLDERFNFSVPGVTSISADTHKYGYAPKGTSVIIYREKKFMHYQYSVQTDWPGGLYASPSIPGSRPGGLIATCWAAMLFHGLDGYTEATDKIIKTTKKIRSELSSIEGIKILGDPQVSVIAFNSDKFSIYKLNDELKSKGWNLNVLQFPSALHLCVTLMHTDGSVASSFIRDVAGASKKLITCEKTNTNGKEDGSAAIYGMAQTISDRSIVVEVCSRYLDACLGH